MSHRLRTLVPALVLLWGLPALASAQGFGIGPRMSFIRGDVAAGTPASRMFGGTIRLRSSPHVALEGALDYRSELSVDGLTRVRERPLQGSILLFLARSTVSPYLLGGWGIYQQTTDTLSGTSTVPVSSTVERKTGAHVGIGAELLLTRHTAFFLDYRYRFVHFGSPTGTEEPINIPIPGLSKLSLAHQGAMVTSGVAFYF